MTNSNKPQTAETVLVERETAWLIERSGEWYAAAPHSSWTVRQAIDPGLWRENWTTDANTALHFSRKQDAEALIRFDGLQNASATQHVFGVSQSLPREGEWVTAAELRSAEEVRDHFAAGQERYRAAWQRATKQRDRLRRALTAISAFGKGPMPGRRQGRGGIVSGFQMIVQCANAAVAEAAGWEVAAPPPHDGRGEVEDALDEAGERWLDMKTRAETAEAQLAGVTEAYKHCIETNVTLTAQLAEAKGEVERWKGQHRVQCSVSESLDEERVATITTLTAQRDRLQERLDSLQMSFEAEGVARDKLQVQRDRLLNEIVVLKEAQSK